MCDTRPGVRCSDHPRNKYKNKLIQSKKVADEINFLKTQKSSLPADSEELTTINSRLEALQAKNVEVDQAVKEWEFEYNASPDGLKELQAAKDNPELNKIERAKAEIDLKVAQKRHAWQLEFSKRLRKEEDGVRGVNGAIELAQYEKENTELKLEKITNKETVVENELNEKEEELAQLEVQYRQNPTPQIKRKEKEVMTTIKFLRMSLHKIRRMKMLYALINGDLDKFIKGKSMKIFKNLAVGTAVLAVEFITGVNKKPEEQPVK